MPFREDFILFNILNNEVVFEEYFCNLLRIGEFRDLVIKFVDSDILNNENIEYKNFDTEKNLDNGCGRADLFLKLDSKEFIFEIKNKDKTELTPKQPEDYLHYLKCKGKNENDTTFNNHLFFLIPNGYEYENKIFEKWKNFNNFNINSIKKQILYWQDLIILIRNEKLEQSNIEIKMFCDFCDYWFDMQQIVFSNEEKELFIKGTKMDEYKTSIPKLMQKLERLTRNIGINTGMREDTNVSGFIYSIKIGDYTIFFGMDYDVWEETKVPLNIIIQNHKNGYTFFELAEFVDFKIKEFNYEETGVYESGFAYIVGIEDEISSDNYQSKVIETIESIKKQFK